MSNISSTKPIISGQLMLQSGTISLFNSDFVADSMIFKSGTSNSGEFTVGAAIIGGLDFALMNDSGKFSNLDWFDSKVSITLSVTKDNYTRRVEMGTYYIVKHYERGNIINVECHDALKILDEYQIYEDKITWPSTIGKIVSRITANRGLTYLGISDADKEIIIPDPCDDLMTERACISYIAQCLGKYVRVDVNGSRLLFEWYRTGVERDVGTTFSHDLRTDDITITGVKVVDCNNTTSETRGTSGYMLNISENPFIDTDNIATFADHIMDAVSGISFRPGDVSIVSDPDIKAGDVFQVSTGKESNINILATTVTYKPSSLQQRITADAEPYAGDLRIKRSTYIKRQAQEAIREELNDSQSDLSQAISGGGGGGGLPSGGYANQFLVKNSSTAGDASWRSLLLSDIPFPYKLMYMPMVLYIPARDYSSGVSTTMIEISASGITKNIISQIKVDSCSIVVPRPEWSIQLMNTKKYKDTDMIFPVKIPCLVGNSRVLVDFRAYWTDIEYTTTSGLIDKVTAATLVLPTGCLTSNETTYQQGVGAVDAVILCGAVPLGDHNKIRFTGASDALTGWNGTWL